MRKNFTEKIYWHDQNLTKNKSDSMWKHGRGWLHWTGNCFHIEWSFFGYTITSTSIEFGFNANDGDGGISFRFGINKLFKIYLQLSSVGRLEKYQPGKWVKRTWEPYGEFWMREERRIGIRLFDNTIWLSLWENPMEWNSTDPWWWSFNFDYVSFLLGKEKSDSIEIESGQCVIPMPERDYQAKYTISDWTWKRSRWPRPKRIRRVELEMDDNPLLVPGKGENSWDLDDDAIYSTIIPADTINEAICELRKSAMRDREKYGGKNWLPAI